MNCRDFERTWNEQLDARERAAPEVEQALETHAAACPACQAVARRYQVLRQAIRAWGTMPAPATPVGFADRFLERYEGAIDRRRGRRAGWIVRFRPVAWSLAIAASLLLAVFAGGHRAWFHRNRIEPVPERTIDPQALSAALADATSATWDLARATSAPAARVGRDVLDETRLPETSSVPLPVEVDPASDVLQRVGDRVNAGVQPFSGTARHAFGFLLGPAQDDANTPPPPPTNKGA